MALNFQLSQAPKLHYAYTGLTSRTEPFGGVTQNLNMPSLLESSPVGPMATTFEGESYTVPSVSPATESWTDSFNAQSISQGMQGASVGMAVGQAVGSVYAAFVSGKTQKYVGKKQAEIAENNRQMAQMSAESAYRQGENQMAQLTYKAGQVKAKQRVAMGANGVVIGSGSTAEVLASTETLKKLDMNTVKLNAISSSWGYKSQGIQASNAGSIAKIMGDYAGKSTVCVMAANLMDKGTIVADRWQKYFGGN